MILRDLGWVKSIVRLWHRLTEPTGTVRQSDQYQQSKLLASFALFLTLLLLPLAGFSTLFANRLGWPSWVFEPMSIAVVFVLSIYLLSRSGRNQTAIVSAVIGGSALIVGTALIVRGDYGFQSLYYFTCIITFSSLLLPLRPTLLIFGGYLVFLLALPLVVAEFQHLHILLGPFTFNLICDGAVLLVAYTYRRRATDRQTQLIISETQYRHLVENIRDIVYFISPKGEFVRLNSAAQAIMGWPLEDLIGQLVAAYIHPEDLERANEAFLTSLRRGLSSQAEIRVRTRFNGYVWMEVRSSPSGVGDKVLGILGIARDITQRKQADKAMQDSERRYRTLFEACPISLWEEDFRPVKGYLQELCEAGVDDLRAYFGQHPEVVDECVRRLKVLNLNSATLKLFGAPSKEAALNSKIEITATNRQLFMEELIAIAEGKTEFQLEGTGSNWAGEPLQLIVSWSLAAGHEDMSCVIVSIVDVTGRKRAEEALRESEERYKLISELISDYAYSYRVEPDGKLVSEWATGAYTRLTGYTWNDPDWKSNYRLYHPDDADQARGHVDLVIQGQQRSDEYRIFTKAGDLKWVRMHRYPVWDENQGRVTRFYGVVQDVTESKQAYLALQESETRYRMVSELISDYAYAYQITPDGRIEHDWTTDSFVRMTGFTPEDLGNTFRLYHPDDAARAARDTERTIAGQATSGEYRIITRSGEVRWVEIYRYPMIDEQSGRVIRYYGVARDVTERKQAEIAVQESEARFRSIFEHAPLGILYLPTLAFGVDDLANSNRRFREMLGYSEAELLHLTPKDITHPDDLAASTAAAISVSSDTTRIIQVEKRYVRKDGSILWAQVSISPFINGLGERAGNVVMIADITERKLAQQRLALLVQQAPLAVVECDTALRVVAWNPAAEHIFGYSAEEASGQRITDLLVPDLLKDSVLQILEQLMVESGIISGSGENITKDGRRIMCEWHNVPLIDGEGHVIGVTGLVQDITLRQQAEVQRIKATLEKERFSLVGNFVLAISHDFRTSLATIETSRYLIERLLDEAGRERVRPKLEKIHKSVLHLTEQLENLTTVSALTDLRTSASRLGPLIEGLVAELAQQANRKTLQLFVEIPPDLPAIHINSREFERALRHLLMNAITYTPNGGRVTIRAYQHGEQIAVEVSDTGMGIARDHLPYIFDQFYRADAARSIDQGGVGLGLSIVKFVVEAYGGSVAVSSELGQGSVFTLYFPAAVLSSAPVEP